jgi:hypothetical protein
MSRLAVCVDYRFLTVEMLIEVKWVQVHGNYEYAEVQVPLFRDRMHPVTNNV